MIRITNCTHGFIWDIFNKVNIAFSAWVSKSFQQTTTNIITYPCPNLLFKRNVAGIYDREQYNMSANDQLQLSELRCLINKHHSHFPTNEYWPSATGGFPTRKATTTESITMLWFHYDVRVSRGVISSISSRWWSADNGHTDTAGNVTTSVHNETAPRTQLIMYAFSLHYYTK